MARVRTNKNICLYCFGDLDNNRVCTQCHKHADDTPSPPHHLPQRMVINNRYLIAKALGEGGFGITYLGWDLTFGIKVAIKEYFPSGYVNRVPKSNQVIINRKENQSASNRGLKRFIDEAKTLAKIKNLSGVVNVRDFFSANGTAYIVMEFLDGVSLKKYVQRKGGKLPMNDVLGIIRPVMESLILVHNLGLIHRDISPDNIILTRYNEVKLIDFGAAKQSNLDGKSLSIVLKQGFAPEEQYRTHGEQGPWTDVYALGATIYYCLTGQLPVESIQRMVKDTIVRPSELGATITTGQENALMKSLAVFKKNRYENVQQMMNGLYNPRFASPRPAVTPKTTSAAEKATTKTAATERATAKPMTTERATAKTAVKPSTATKTTAAERPTKNTSVTEKAAAKPSVEKTTRPATKAVEKDPPKKSALLERLKKK